jgi:YrbI family 3-deoxy-D-manno-octulosonate 8-phosphate phosphatase
MAELEGHQDRRDQRAPVAGHGRARAPGKMSYVYQGHIEKIPILEEILADAKIDASEVAYIGDDFTDVVIMNRVGLAIATANARAEVKKAAHYVTQGPGRRRRGARSGGTAAQGAVTAR